MSGNEEQMKILHMLHNGVITKEQADQLLNSVYNATETMEKSSTSKKSTAAIGRCTLAIIF